MSMRGGGGGRGRVSGSDYAAQKAANAEAPKIPDLLPRIASLFARTSCSSASRSRSCWSAPA